MLFVVASANFFYCLIDLFVSFWLVIFWAEMIVLYIGLFANLLCYD